MLESENQFKIALPENLRQKFTALERRLWKVETASAVCVGLLGVFGSFAILFFSDRFFETLIGLRATLLFGAIGIIVLAAVRWSFRWIFLRRDWRALSVIVQRKFRKLGDHLLGIVELSNESKHDVNFSPELYRAAINQVAAETAPFDFREAVETRLTKRLIAATIVLALLVLIPSLLIPALGKNVFHRWITPLAMVPRYTLVQIDGLPEKLVVPHGENFDLRAKVVYRSFWKPSGARAKFQTQNLVSGKVNANEVRFQIPAQIQNGILRIKVGDATRDISIVPTYRPALKQISASIQLPEYLQVSATNQTINNGILNLLEGSAFSLRGKISRPLEMASIALTNKTMQGLQISGDEFSSGIFSNATAHLEFLWRDQFGLSNATPWKLSIRSQKDLPASPALPDLPSDVAMLESDVLEIRSQAKDDFGVRDVGLSWDFASDENRPAGSTTTEVKIQPKSRQEKTFEKIFRWSPAIYRIPEDSSVELIAFARDYFPERERAETAVHRIHVLGKEKHAEFVRQKLESLLARVEEVARLEEKVLANTSELHDNEKLSDQQKSERAGKVSEEQDRNAKNLNELAKEGMKALQEGLKNPVFTEQALQEWAKNLQEMQNLAQKEMKAAGDKLKSAQKSSSADSRKNDLVEAQKKEQEIVDALEKMQGKVNKDLDDLQALTLAERLRKVGSTETGISGELQKVIPETIGLLPKELPEKFKKLARSLALQQEGAHTESQQLRNEINRFFERTQKENYGEVSKEITEAKTVEELERVGGLIQENIAMEASKNLGEWAARFQKWADKLEPPKEEGGKGDGKGGESPADMTKTLVALLRLREKEITLREQTGLLNEQRGDEKNYKERAAGLSGTQKKLGEDLDKLSEENEQPALMQPFAQAGDAMKEVVGFLQKPQTDKVTLAAQVKSVDLLTDLVNLINEQAKRQSSQSPPPEGSGESEAEQMAFLMQMMSKPGKPGEAMALNPQGGGNQSGGTTDKAGGPGNGGVDGKTGETRRVEKASGSAGASLPAEFRETLESYFKAVEREAN
ncbi:MAG: hypothetical protein ABI042_01025 [Verrucomicrobiota bacterium]